MTNREYLFLILKCALGDADLADTAALSESEVAYLYNAAKAHSLLPMVAKVLIENGLCDPSSEYFQTFRDQMLKYVCRREQFDYVLSSVCDALNRAEIPHMPLKGSVLKDYYPEPWLRTGCDIDILVEKHDLERAAAVLSDDLKYTFFSKSTHDIAYTSESGVLVELHYDLNEPGYKVFEPLSRIWEVAESVDGAFMHRMPAEYIYLYHIAHMAKHFVGGGCGVRFLVDLRVILGNFELDRHKVDSLLEACGLAKFNAAVLALCDVWFSGKQHDRLTEALEEYILTGGTYGSLQNKVALHQAKKGGWFKYTLSRIFLPYDRMVIHYPVLRDKKWLTPFCEVARWFRLLFGGGLRIISIVFKLNVSSQPARSESAGYLSDQLGL